MLFTSFYILLQCFGVTWVVFWAIGLATNLRVTALQGAYPTPTRLPSADVVEEC